MKNTMASLLLGLLVLGCAHQNAGVADTQLKPPPTLNTTVTAEVNSYIADIRSLIAEMENIRKQTDSLPDISLIKDSPVFNSTLKLLDSFFLESMKVRNPQLFLDKVHRFEERVKMTADINTYRLVRETIELHIKRTSLSINVARLDKKIDAMEPRLHELRNSLIMAYSQNPYGTNYAAIVAILQNEQQRFIRKINELSEYFEKKTEIEWTRAHTPANKP
jgi:hypothetical protein